MTNLSAATRAGDGATVFSDGPWTIRIRIAQHRGRPYIRRLQVDVKDPEVRPTAARLARLPLAHLLHVASAHAATADQDRSHPNEALYRLLAVPKPAGSRSWPDGHYERVLEVYRWARESDRPGGGRRAVAEFWMVTIDPTVNRWLAEARRRAARGDTRASDPAAV